MDKITDMALKQLDEIEKLNKIIYLLGWKYLPEDDVVSFMHCLDIKQYDVLIKYLGGSEELN